MKSLFRTIATPPFPVGVSWVWGSNYSVNSPLKGGFNFSSLFFCKVSFLNTENRNFLLSHQLIYMIPLVCGVVQVGIALSPNIERCDFYRCFNGSVLSFAGLIMTLPPCPTIPGSFPGSLRSVRWDWSLGWLALLVIRWPRNSSFGGRWLRASFFGE